MIKIVYISKAKWPVGTISKTSRFPNISTDEHDSEGAAIAVCNALKKEGFSGEGEIFPIDTLVVKEVRIEATYTQETGRWNYIANEFLERVESTFTKTLLMEIDGNAEKPILRFINGPTGFESYYIEDLLHPNNYIGDRGDEFCICGGTINRWPRCIVSSADIVQYLKLEGFINAL